MVYLLVIILALSMPLPVIAGELEMKAGVARIDLTPPLEWRFSLGGYGARMSKPAQRIHDRIFAKALVLNNGEKKYAIVTMDVLALPPNVRPQVIEKINDESWRVENVMLLPSHTHTSLDMTALNNKNILNIPQLGIFQPKLLEFVVSSLAKVIVQAGEKLQPVKVGTASAMVEGMNRNRRGDGLADKELTVTRFDTQDGKTLAVLVNWTAHPTIMDENDMWVSGGWPGCMQRELEAWIGDGVIVMYHNGAEGDQSPTGAQGASHYQAAEDYGRKIAVEALGAYRTIKLKPNPVFDFKYQTIALPKRVAHPLFMATGGAEYGIDEEAMQVILQVMVPEQTMCSAVRIGDMLIAGVPGEMTCELGLAIKKKLREAGIPHPVIGGLANEWISYILSAEEYEQGGYESSVSFYGASLGEVIVEGVLKTAMDLTK